MAADPLGRQEVIRPLGLTEARDSEQVEEPAGAGTRKEEENIIITQEAEELMGSFISNGDQLIKLPKNISNIQRTLITMITDQRGQTK